MGTPPFEQEQTKIKQAMSFLRAALILGPRPASEMEDMARAYGFIGTTLYKARRRAGVRSERKGNQWIWSLAEQRKQEAIASGKKA
jgi:hypothetical protein